MGWPILSSHPNQCHYQPARCSERANTYRWYGQQSLSQNRNTVAYPYFDIECVKFNQKYLNLAFIERNNQSSHKNLVRLFSVLSQFLKHTEIRSTYNNCHLSVEWRQLNYFSHLCCWTSLTQQEAQLINIGASGNILTSLFWFISLQTQEIHSRNWLVYGNSFLWNSCESMPSFKDILRLPYYFDMLNTIKH